MLFLFLHHFDEIENLELQIMLSFHCRDAAASMHFWRSSKIFLTIYCRDHGIAVVHIWRRRECAAILRFLIPGSHTDYSCTFRPQAWRRCAFRRFCRLTTRHLMYSSNLYATFPVLHLLFGVHTSHRVFHFYKILFFNLKSVCLITFILLTVRISSTILVPVLGRCSRFHRFIIQVQCSDSYLDVYQPGFQGYWALCLL